MANWIFKISEQELYPDEPGAKYVFDNTHSTQVTADDCFVYLDKRGKYAFTGHGTIRRITRRSPGASDVLRPRVRKIQTAHLVDFVPYPSPIDIKPNTRNRLELGIINVNDLGWSRSVASLSDVIYERIVDLAYRQGGIELPIPTEAEYEVPDKWSKGKRRHGLTRWKEAVRARQGSICGICGTRLKEVLDVAHVRDYAIDKRNRANPANGIVLCSYCHRAFDKKAFVVVSDGSVRTESGTRSDPVARAHLSAISAEERMQLWEGVDRQFLIAQT